jgi:hypothetical protein
LPALDPDFPFVASGALSTRLLLSARCSNDNPRMPVPLGKEGWSTRAAIDPLVATRATVGPGDLADPPTNLLAARCAHLDAECDVRAATEEEVPGFAVAGDGDLAAEFRVRQMPPMRAPTRRSRMRRRPTGR